MKSEELQYTPNYCEENIWHLAGDPRLGPGDRWVVLLTSPAKSTPLWHQKASPGEDDPVFWDYHVILVQRTKDGAGVYDFDSKLPFPAPFGDYVRATFGPARSLPFNYHPRFRVLSAEEYRRSFSSDRGHMKLKNGAWRSPPPPWPPIQASGGAALSLGAALDIRKPEPGQVLDLDGFTQRF